MSNELLNEFTFFVLAIFVGIEVISKVPTILHTPLMSGTNAIHGIILVGAIVIAAGASSPVNIVLGLVAVILATTNVVGGFVVTDRMLEMFKGRNQAQKQPRQSKNRRPQMNTLIALAYLVAAVCFILGLKQLSSPKGARNGNRIAAVGMVIAIVATLPRLHFTTAGVIIIAIGVVIGGAVGSRRRPHGEDDRHPADGRPVQRRGRWRRGPRCGGRAAQLRSASRFRGSVSQRLQHRDRLGLVRGQHGGLRQAAGADDRDARSPTRASRSSTASLPRRSSASSSLCSLSRRSRSPSSR